MLFQGVSVWKGDFEIFLHSAFGLRGPHYVLREGLYISLNSDLELTLVSYGLGGVMGVHHSSLDAYICNAWIAYGF